MLFGHQHCSQLGLGVQHYWKSQWHSLCRAKLAREKGLISYGLLRQGHLDDWHLKDTCLILLPEIQIVLLIK